MKYGYVDTKEELLELLVDEVYGRIVAKGPIRGGLREALRVIAHRTRDVSREHPWFVSLLSGHIHRGPNALAHLEASLAAVAPHFTPSARSSSKRASCVKSVRAG